MAGVNKINITCVSVKPEAEAGKYRVMLSWEVDEGSAGYAGDFFLVVWHEGVEAGRIKIDCGGAKVRRREARNVALDKSKVYAVSLDAGGTKPAACGKVWITLRTFEGLSARCADDALTVEWDPVDASVADGVLRIGFSSGGVCEYGVPKSPRTFVLPEAEFRAEALAGESCSVGIVPRAPASGDADSSGPESESLALALRPSAVASVSLGELKNDARELSVSFAAPAPAHVLLALRDGGRQVHETGILPCGGPLKHTLRGQIAHDAERCELAVFTADAGGKARNLRLTDANRVPLAVPALKTDFSAGKLALSWSGAGPGCAGYSLRLGDGAEREVFGGTHVFDESPSEFMDAPITLAPKYGEKRGPAARMVAFREGFYCAGGSVAYRAGSYAAKGCSFALPASAFSVPPEEAVERGKFKLAKDGGAHRVTVASDAPALADFNEWLKALFGKTLTPEGYYRIRGALSRLLAVPEAERLWYAAGILQDADGGPSGRAEAMPGMTLRVESAVYMPQTRPTAAKLAGYVPSGAVEHAITLSGGALSASPFLRRAMGHFAYAGEPGDEAPAVAGGGGLDFFNIDLKRPHWLLAYPERFFRSENPADLYAAGNTALFAFQNWEDTQSADPDAHDYLVFRARSTVTLLFTVLVNSVPRAVPVGSTLGDLLSTLGCSAPGLKMRRETGLGSACEVFRPEEGMFLLGGDRVDV